MQSVAENVQIDFVLQNANKNHGERRRNKPNVGMLAERKERIILKNLAENHTLTRGLARKKNGVRKKNFGGSGDKIAKTPAVSKGGGLSEKQA